MISASAVVLGFGLQEHFEDTSWPFNYFLQAVPSVCKIIQINNYYARAKIAWDKNKMQLPFFLGVFNSCLRPKRIRSDLKSIINQFITYIADQKNVSS